MNPSSGDTQILLVDRQDHWRESAAWALADAGFDVTGTDDYKLPAGSDKLLIDLVVLGCARIGPEETGLIREMARHKLHVIVLSTSLPWDSMRSAFLAGAYDVTEKTYEAERVVDLVRQTLATLSSRDQYLLAQG